MATRVTYNGVTLHNVTTRDFRQEILYDASDTDKIGSRFFLSFDGVIHNQRVPRSGGGHEDLDHGITYSDPEGPTNTSSSAAAVYQRLRMRLSEPRKTLRVAVGATNSASGDTMLSVHPMGLAADQDGDIENGPKPIKVDITSITGSALFRVRFDIQCAIGLCSPGQANIVLSNRWSITESMDANFFVERRIDGRLRLAHGVFEIGNAGSIPGHVHKHLCMPILETGFKRIKVDFASEEDGLNCTYSVTDKQVHTAAPYPATKMSATHSESFSDGAKFISQVYVRLEGPPSADKRLLIERAIDIAENRLSFVEQSANEAKQQIEYAEIIDHIGEENAVELSIRIHQLVEAGEHLTRLRQEALGSPLDLPEKTGVPTYDPKLSPAPALYGYDPHGGERRPAVLWVLHCYLQDPCSGEHGINGNSLQRTDDFDDPLPSGTEVQEQDPSILRDLVEHDHYSDEAKTAIYTYCKLVSEYGVNEMKVAMPLSKLNTSHINTNVVFDLCEPQSWRKIEVDAERIGKPPQIGTPLSTYSDGRLVATRMSHKICLFPPVLTPDGRKEVFRVTATTVYSLNYPPSSSETLRMGVPSYTKGTTTRLPLSRIYSDSLA